MTAVLVSKVIVDSNVRSINGVDDIASVKFEDLPLDEMAGIKELAESIKENGLIQPISVKTGKGGNYRLVTGWRRLMAHRYLGRERVSAHVLKGKKADEPLLQLIENIQRKDLNAMDVARSLSSIREMRGISSQDKLANLVKKSPAWVSQHLSLLDAAPEIQEAVEGKEIGVGGARAIASLPKDEQAPALDEAKKEAKKAGSVDKKTGKVKVKTKEARRQARKKKNENKNRQLPIRPVAEREAEQKEEFLTKFFNDVHGQSKISKAQRVVASDLWDYLFEEGRLVIK